MKAACMPNSQHAATCTPLSSLETIGKNYIFYFSIFYWQIGLRAKTQDNVLGKFRPQNSMINISECMTVVRVFHQRCHFDESCNAWESIKLEKMNTGAAHILSSHIIDRGPQTERNECVRMFPHFHSNRCVVCASLWLITSVQAAMGEGVLYPGEGLVKRKIDKYYGVRPLRVATVKPHYGHLDLNWRNHFKDLLKDSTQLSLLACFHALWPPVPLGSQYAGCKHIICWHGVDAGGMLLATKIGGDTRPKRWREKLFCTKGLNRLSFTWIDLSRPSVLRLSPARWSSDGEEPTHR